MIPKVKELKLISIYLYICDIYNSNLKNSCQRLSNNIQPEFTDQVVMTIYLLTDKGFCSTKSMYYYGLKLHALAFRRPSHLPFPESLIITPSSENDLNVQKQYWSSIINRIFYSGKIYNDEDFFKNMTETNNSTMLTPVKAVKNQSETIVQRDKVANDLYLIAVSKIRQPIETLFNWLIEKTDIQRASKVRSTKGLIVHVFG